MKHPSSRRSSAIKLQQALTLLTVPLLAAFFAYDPISSPPAEAGAAEVQGDVNCDGVINSVDSLQILRASVGLPADAACLEEAGDTDCDGDRDAVDALRVLRHIAGLGNTSVPGCPAISEALGAGLLLNEVLFLPAQSDATFVELINAGDSPVSTDGYALENEDGSEFDLAGLGPVAPGGLLLAGGELIDDASGYVELQLDGENVDRVAWGDEPDAVPMTLGGIEFDPEPGRSLNRAPGATGSGRHVWGPGDATPGAENSIEVAPSIPFDGAIVPPGELELAWYPTPGASEYHVELAADDAFAGTIVDATVADQSFVTPALAGGGYFWRVTPDSGPTGEVRSLIVATDAAPLGLPQELEVPHVAPVKDTDLLLLESDHQSGPYTWDGPQQYPGPLEPGLRPFEIGSIAAMMNKFLGGDITVDRIGYEAFHDRKPGPERDLPYNDAFPHQRVTDILDFALGSSVESCGTDLNERWAYLTAAIDVGIPLMGTEHDIGALIFGYEEREVETSGETETVRAIRVQVGVLRFLHAYNVVEMPCFWHVGDEIDPFLQPPVDHSDVDNDGVLYFDEVNRFHTDPEAADTDGDGLNDKDDIAASVFDAGFGYSTLFHEYRGEIPFGLPLGRDVDRDTLANERDCDSDDDGIPDGEDDDIFVKADPPGNHSCTTPVAYIGRTSFALQGDATNPAHTAYSNNVLFIRDAQDPMRYEAVSGTLTYSIEGPSGLNCEVSGMVEKEIVPGDASFGLFFPGPPAMIIGRTDSDSSVPVMRVCGDQEPVEEMREARDWFFEQGGSPIANPNRIEGEYAPNFAGNPVWTWDLYRTATPP